MKDTRSNKELADEARRLIAQRNENVRKYTARLKEKGIKRVTLNASTEHEKTIRALAKALALRDESPDTMPSSILTALSLIENFVKGNHHVNI